MLEEMLIIGLIDTWWCSKHWCRYLSLNRRWRKIELEVEGEVYSENCISIDKYHKNESNKNISNSVDWDVDRFVFLKLVEALMEAWTVVLVMNLEVMMIKGLN